jgi:hypothetical protein
MSSKTNWSILREICNGYSDVLVIKVRSGYGTIIQDPVPDPTWTGPSRTHKTEADCGFTTHVLVDILLKF